ncbi:MAG: 50S ribosomal protein L29 [Weeksellaceae bacterium]|nr:50S ribosomal protein L29 [Weeksellaceae bacterium]
MKSIDIQELTIEDIQTKLEEEKLKYDKLRITHKLSQIENPMQLRSMRRNIARLNTALTQKKKSQA